MVLFIQADGVDDLHFAVTRYIRTDSVMDTPSFGTLFDWRSEKWCDTIMECI